MEKQLTWTSLESRIRSTGSRLVGTVTGSEGIGGKRATVITSGKSDPEGFLRRWAQFTFFQLYIVTGVGDQGKKGGNSTKR